MINGANGKHPCGASNYYIDDQAAGGTWGITKPQPLYWQGCPAGLPGGAAGLYLYPNDTAKLTVGWHTLKIDYLGIAPTRPHSSWPSFWWCHKLAIENIGRSTLKPHRNAATTCYKKNVTSAGAR